MNNIAKIIFVFMSFFLFTACEDEMIEVNPDFKLSFQRDGKENALAGEQFFIFPTGSGEFITLFDGTQGRVFGEPGAKGVDFNKADSLGITYNSIGKYNITIVSTSTSKNGSIIERKHKTVEVTVIDQRNSFNTFTINNIPGTIGADGEIKFSVPDNTTDFNFKPVFTLNSPLAKVYVDGVEQVSAVTSNDFSTPVTYVIKSAEGTEKTYRVVFTTFPASNEKNILKFNLSSVAGSNGNGEVGLIDNVNKSITIAANYGSRLNNVRLVVETSFQSVASMNGIDFSSSRFYNLTTLTSVKVTAQDKSEAVYTLNVSSLDPVETFTFAGLVPAPVGIIDKTAKTITVNVLKGTDITKLIAVWKGSVGTVRIGTANQINGVTVNDFTSPKTYTFFRGTTAGDSYVVTVIEK